MNNLEFWHCMVAALGVLVWIILANILGWVFITASVVVLLFILAILNYFMENY